MRAPRARHHGDTQRGTAVAGLTDHPPAVAVLVAAVGAVGLSLFVAGVFDWGRPPGVTMLLGLEPTSRLGALILGLVLLVLARGLAGRRIAAQRVLLVVLGIAAVGALVGQHSGTRAGVLAVLFVAVLLVRDAFPAQPDARRVRVTLLCSGAVLATTVVGSSSWLVWRAPDLHHRAGAAHAAEGSLGGLVGLSGVVQRALPAGPDPAGVLLLVGGCTAIVALLVVFASRPAPLPADALVRARVGALAALPENDTFAPFVLRHDKTYVFSSDGRAAIGFRVLFGVAMVGGDPVGHSGSFGAAIDAFLRRCAVEGWRPFVIGARGDRAELWRARGLHTIGIGDEVVADVENFTLDTPRLRNVRQAVKRTHNFGVTTTVVAERELPADVRSELEGIMRQCWGGLPERGFSMNLDGLLTGIHPDALLVICRDGAGRAVAFQRHVLCSGGTALSLDTMCRLPHAPNGVNERMIVDVLAWGHERGVRAASLNFAAFRPLFDAEHRSRLEALGYWGIHRLDRWIKLESLYQFNAKFRPQWVPRSVVLRSWADLPALAPAAIAAEFGGLLDRRRPSTEVLAAEAAATRALDAAANPATSA